MAREFAFTDPSTKRTCEEDYISPPWFLEEDVVSSGFTGSSTAGSADDAGGDIEITSL